ncbi:MAG: hypothetical protein RL313_196 [Actinomycetota bacterium]|jgi:hypothetical protein
MFSEPEFSYEERYGKEPSKRWLIPAIALLVLGSAWIIWAGTFHSYPNLRSTLYSFAITGEKEVSIRYGIERKNGEDTVVCTLVAYDFDKNVVAQIDDEILPGEKELQRITVVPTRSAPVSAAISRCRIK